MNFFAILLADRSNPADRLSRLKKRVKAWKVTVDAQSLCFDEVTFLQYDWGSLAYSNNCQVAGILAENLTIIVGQSVPPSLSALLQGINKNSTVSADGFFAYVACGLEYAVIGTDQLGMNPLYVDDNDSPSVFSNYSTLAGCLSDRCEPNLGAILDYATKDSLLENDSFVEGIHRSNRGSVFRCGQCETSLMTCCRSSTATVRHD